MKLTVQSTEDHGDVRVLRFSVPPDFPAWQAGHYAFLQFGEFAPRPYSIASPPDAGFLEFHIRNTHHHGGSTLATTGLHVGDTVTFHGFGGNYAYTPDCRRPFVLIAGGTGLSSLLAIVRASLRHTPDRPLFLYVGGRHLSDLYYHSSLQSLAESTPSLSYIPVLSEERQNGMAFGMVGDIALSHAPNLADCRLYVAGPVDMVRDVVSKALAKGISPDVLHSDLSSMSKT